MDVKNPVEAESVSAEPVALNDFSKDRTLLITFARNRRILLQRRDELRQRKRRELTKWTRSPRK